MGPGRMGRMALGSLRATAQATPFPVCPVRARHVDVWLPGSGRDRIDAVGAWAISRATFQCLTRPPQDPMGTRARRLGSRSPSPSGGRVGLLVPPSQRIGRALTLGEPATRLELDRSIY